MRDVVERVRGTSSEERRRHVVDVLTTEFGDLAADDPEAIRRKFRKMARDPFSFYRGTACLFYSDLTPVHDPFVDDRTSLVWIQGDLHAENFGTYLNSDGVLVFDVNDFDEAYLGHWTWDLARLAASVAVLGYGRAFSDDDISRMVETAVGSYADQVQAFVEGEDDQQFALELGNTRGAVHELLVSARTSTRIGQLEDMSTVEEGDRHFVAQPGHTRHLDDDEREAVVAAFEQYLESIPAQKRQASISYALKDCVAAWGFGIGSAGLPAFNLLVEGRTQALENDVVLSMKQGSVPALARWVTDDKVRDAFHHPGERTAVSTRALQSHSDPWLGHCRLHDRGQVVKELSPYEQDLDWDDVVEPDDAVTTLEQLGRAAAKVHCVGDTASEQDLVTFSVEDAIAAVLEDGREELTRTLVEVAHGYGEQVRDDHRLFVDAFRNHEIADL